MTAIAAALAACRALVPTHDDGPDAVIITDAEMQTARLDRQLRATVARNEAARINRVLSVCAEALRGGKVHRLDILATDAADVEERAEQLRRLGCEVTGPHLRTGNGYCDYHAALAHLHRADGSNEIALVVSIATGMVRS